MSIVLHRKCPESLKFYGNAFRQNNIKLSVTPPVMMELFRNCKSERENTKQDAIRAWNLLISPEYSDLFNTYPPSNTSTHADSNLVDAARNLKLRYEKNVMILTSDKKLTSSIYNACCTESLDGVGGKVQVLIFDQLTAKLTRYHASRLENVSKDVLIPDWHLIGAPKVRPWHERYFHTCISKSIVFMDSCALRYVVDDSKKTNFCANLESLTALRPGQKIHVVSTSLYDSEIRKKVEAMPHLFHVVEAYNPMMREDDAIFQAMLDAAGYTRTLRMLLITNKIGRFDSILHRLPTCHNIGEFWGCRIDSQGFLRSTSQNLNSDSNQAA